MVWKFELTYNSVTIEAEEPVGWDSVKFDLKRGQFEHGLFFEFSTKLKFYRDARAFIQNAWDVGNIDAIIDISISVRGEMESSFTLFYEGVILLNQIRIDKDFAEISLEPSTFLRNFKARKDLDVGLVVNKTVGLHSKTIKKSNVSRVNPLLAIVNVAFGNNASFAVPWEWQTTELPEALTTSSYAVTESIFYNADTQTINVNGRQKFFVSKGTTNAINVKITLLEKTNSGATLNQTIILYDQTAIPYTRVITDPITTYIWDFDVLFDEDVVMPDASNLYYIIEINNTTGSSDTVISLDSGEDLSFLELFAFTKTEPSTADGLLVFTALKALVLNYTGLDVFQSDFFQTGLGQHIFMTNGFQIRGFSDKPIFTNFDNLYDALRKIFNLGISVTQTAVRVEPMAYWYSNTELLECEAPSSVSREIATEWHWNKIKLGYNEWKDDAIGQVNGLDEFNSTRQYSTKLGALITRDEEKNRKELNLQSSDVITSGYLIEHTRRQFKTSKNFKFDEKIFLISLNRGEVTSSLYTTPAVSTIYPIGTVSERNENFTSVTNVIDAPTAYNLIFSPLRVLRRNRDLIQPSLIKNNANLQDVGFRSGEGNYQMIAEGNDALSIDNIVIDEQGTYIITTAGVYIAAEFIKFEYPITFAQFEDLRTIQGYIRTYLGIIEVRGWLVELSYEPNKGLGKFTLLRKLPRLARLRRFKATTMNFGDVNIGDTSVYLGYPMISFGDASATITSIAADSGDAPVYDNNVVLPDILASGDIGYYSMSYSPIATVGAKSGNMVFTGDFQESPLNVPWIANVIALQKYALNFNGLTQYLQSQTTAQGGLDLVQWGFTQTFTFRVVIKDYVPQTGTRSVYDARTVIFNGILLSIADNKVQLFMRSDLNILFVISDTVLTAGDVDIAITYDGSRLASGVNFYVNDVLTTKTISSNNLAGFDNLGAIFYTIGNNNNVAGFVTFLSATIKHLSFVNYVKSVAEMSADFIAKKQSIGTGAWLLAPVEPIYKSDGTSSQIKTLDVTQINAPEPNDLAFKNEQGYKMSLEGYGTVIDETELETIVGTYPQ